MDNKEKIRQIELDYCTIIQNLKKEMSNKIDAIIKNCNHSWTYIPDPSGNNDSGYSCKNCGKWSKHET